MALAGVDLTIRRGEFFSLLGPSGCGKTTLLRILAGLDLPDAGSVRIGGVEAADIAAHRRPVNTVFQSYALFPHLTVGENVAFGLRMKKVPPAEIARRTAGALELVRITPFADRKPAQLSGGQKQRVALARALVNEPQVLLLDEPLGALDLKLRKELQVELSSLQRRLGITFVYVTHDQEEALVMSDRIAVMRAGTIEQVGEAEAIYERPRTRFVAQFLGSCNLVAGEVLAREGERLRVRTPLGELVVEAPGEARSGTVSLAIRPEKVVLEPPITLETAASGPNRVAVEVEHVIYGGATSEYRLRAGEARLSAHGLNHLADGAQLQAGAAATAFLPPGSLRLLEDE